MASALGAFLRGFLYAGRGLRVLAASQRNFRFHLVAAAAVLGTGLHLELARWEWVAVGLCIALVMAMEAMNTAVEFLADRVCREHDPLIGLAKDVAAAAVLLAALGAAGVGGLVFLPHI